MEFVSTCTIPLEEYTRLKKLEADYEHMVETSEKTKKAIDTFMKPFLSLNLSQTAFDKFKKAIEENKFSARLDDVSHMPSFEDPLNKKTSLTLNIVLDGEFYIK